LVVEPIIPSDWLGFDAVRNFRGVRYIIHVERQGTGNTVALEVNGRVINGTVVPLPSDDTLEIHVKARVG
jgi:cellobiose phosphorylase